MIDLALFLEGYRQLGGAFQRAGTVPAPRRLAITRASSIPFTGIGTGLNIPAYSRCQIRKRRELAGYSLPREDQFARLVFRRGVRNNILKASKIGEKPATVVVVNPDPATEVTFSRLVGREVAGFDFQQTYFEDYVASLQE